MHPHHFSLNLLKIMYEKAPPGTPDAIIKAAQSAYEKLYADPSVAFETVEAALYDNGMALWPYRVAYEEFYALHGKLMEERAVREALSSELAAKYENFLRDGGSLENFRKGAEFEEFFTPEEKYELGIAEHAAHEGTEEDLRERIRTRAQEFAEAVALATAARDRMVEKIRVLAGLAERGKTWKDEISRRVALFHNSLAGLDRHFREADIDAAINYYYDTIKLTDEPVQVVDNETIPV